MAAWNSRTEQGRQDGRQGYCQWAMVHPGALLFPWASVWVLSLSLGLTISLSTQTFCAGLRGQWCRGQPWVPPPPAPSLFPGRPSLGQDTGAQKPQFVNPTGVGGLFPQSPGSGFQPGLPGWGSVLSLCLSSALETNWFLVGFGWIGGVAPPSRALTCLCKCRKVPSYNLGRGDLQLQSSIDTVTVGWPVSKDLHKFVQSAEQESEWGRTERDERGPGLSSASAGASRARSACCGRKSSRRRCVRARWDELTGALLVTQRPPLGVTEQIPRAVAICEMGDTGRVLCTQSGSGNDNGLEEYSQLDFLSLLPALFWYNGECEDPEEGVGPLRPRESWKNARLRLGLCSEAAGEIADARQVSGRRSCVCVRAAPLSPADGRVGNLSGKQQDKERPDGLREARAAVAGAAGMGVGVSAANLGIWGQRIWDYRDTPQPCTYLTHVLTCWQKCNAHFCIGEGVPIMPLDRGDADCLQSQTQRSLVFWGLKIKKKLKAVPFLGKVRPAVGLCCHQCTPDSLGLKLLRSSPFLGFRNILCVNETLTRYRGWLVRRVCCVLFVGQCRVYPSPRGDRAPRVISSSRVQRALSLGGPGEGAVASDGSSAGLLECGEARRGQAEHMLAMVNTSICPWLLRIYKINDLEVLIAAPKAATSLLNNKPLKTVLVAWLLLKLLGRVFCSVQVNLNQLEALGRASERGPPLVLVSVHCSSLDYIFIPLVLFCHGLRVPYTICEESLESTWLRAVLQKLGVILPPRQPVGAEGSVTDSLCREIMASYVSELLQEGESVLIFLEDPSPTSRRPSPSSALRVAQVRQAVRSGAVPDVMLVPVGVAYDCVGQETGTSGVQAAQGQGVLRWALASLWRSRWGCVRLHFAQPFSLKEMEESGRHRVGGRPLEDILLPVVLNRRLTCVVEEVYLSWVLPPDCCPDLSEPQRHQVISLTTHLLHSASSCTAVMSTSLLSCLLLHKHRKGVRLSQLCRDFSWLLEEVLFRNRDVGFGGSLEEVLCHALSLLRDSLIVGEALCSVFRLEAVGACAVSSMLSEAVLCANESEMEFDVSLCQEELTERALQLCHLLPDIVLPPCQSAHSFAMDAVDSLVHCGILVMEESSRDRPVCDLWQQRDALRWKSVDEMEYSDSDCEDMSNPRCYKLSQPSQCPELLFFLCRLLSAQLRALCWATEALPQLHLPLPEAQCIEQLHAVLCDRAQTAREYYESASLELDAAAIHTFTDLGVLCVESGKCLGLRTEFQQKKNREMLHSFISQFLFSYPQ
ncbi:GPAT2 acyltransferase, partial [Atractosteus spatula]|nr:GPAT2 acyltransferase [Atractosteus spatula]